MIPLLLPGIIVASMRCMLRSLAEQKNIYVETVVDFDEIRQLARADGWTLDHLFQSLRVNGASSVSISEDTLSSLESEGKITVLSSKEIRKLSLDESYEINLPTGVDALAGLWVYSEDTALLDRITQNLSWKLPEEALIRLHRNVLLINKSGKGLMERVGLGFSKEYFDMADNAGLGIVVRLFNYPGLSADNASKIINSIPSPASVSALLCAEEEMLGARGELNKIISLFENRSYRIGWIEFNVQDGITQYLNGLSKNRPFVRVHSISRKEMDLAYNVERAKARMVRAVKDRSLKMLYFRCFLQDDKKYISNLTEFNLKYLRNTVDELEKSGYKIARTSEERLSDPRHIVGRLIPAEALAIGIALLLGIPMLLRLSFMPEIGGFGALLCAFIGFVIFFLSKEYFIAICGVVGAITYSTMGLMWASDSLEHSGRGYFKSAFVFFLWLVIPSVIGGLLIAGLHSNIEYMLKFEQFRGIKLSFIVPIIFVVMWALKKYGRNVFTLLQKPINVVSAIVLVGIFASLALYILRSGNFPALKPTATEDAFRTFLENLLVARPRNKEFLVGYPAAMLFILLFRQHELLLLPLLSIFIQMGQVSVVNTMCHFHTPIILSCLRIFNGLWVGIVIGTILVVAWRLLQILLALGKGKQKRIFLIGYFGYGNAGDELLRETCTKKILENFKDYTVSILIGNKLPARKSDSIKYVRRRSFTDVIEELIKSEAVIVPGGGVFQSITSSRSMFYYYVIIRIARALGTKVILPAQGLGPWKEGKSGDWLHKHLGEELRLATYISVRDNSSVEMFKEVTSSEAYVEVATDMAFLNESIINAEKKARKDSMKLYAIIRNSVRDSVAIATDLMTIARDNENLELVPVAFQQHEDTLAWKKAGWTDEIKLVNDFENAFEGADLVVSMRLHGCILATAQGIPWIGITYDPKVDGFAEGCKWKEFCCQPAEANQEFFEQCINKLAFEYERYSEDLIKYTEKMNQKANKDFDKMVKSISGIFILLFCLMGSSAVWAENKFPAWMDEVEFKQTEVQQIKGPVDPSTGKVSELVPVGRNFRPRLPDFKELRKKATKTTIEGNNVLESTETSGIETKPVDSGSTVASGTLPKELATATEIIEAAYRASSETANAVSATLKNEDEEREPTDEELRQRRIYKPGQFKSYYLEVKEQERKMREDAE